jgi:DNA replication protein DnaC
LSLRRHRPAQIFRRWRGGIGEPTFADAILDRLVHNSYRLELDGPSMRKTRSGKGEKTA